MRLLRFIDDEGGTGAIEFAFLLPILIAVLLGGTQLVSYINAQRKLDLVARMISEMVSQVVPPTGSTTATVDASDIHFSYDSAMVLFPYVLTDARRQGLSWWQDISINYASIRFTGKPGVCPNPSDQSNCYTANVIWTSSGTSQPASGPNFRPCGTPQAPADDKASPNRATLPRSVYGPASIIVIDVLFTFIPTFGAKFLQPLRISRTIYVQPRYATLVDYDTTNDDGIVVKCAS